MMKVAMMMNWLDVQNTNDRPVTVVMKKFLCEAREAGLVGRILHWNIVEHGGGWNIVELNLLKDKTVQPCGE